MQDRHKTVCVIMGAEIENPGFVCRGFAALDEYCQHPTLLQLLFEKSHRPLPGQSGGFKIITGRGIVVETVVDTRI